ncbi:hypothetical protein J2T55_000965 [Methylohalomonas lacus]|uniref:Uncharacterized protein n=1 Tax=Methylohalomonas lacus TaxID=398773 RepID=A0AAE3HM21_9GAMM|nr:hypothetical protein [Methylohalomonas lacus]MCS3902957.1 hypothetical protein [Methylohalomonas lacus]
MRVIKSCILLLILLGILPLHAQTPKYQGTGIVDFIYPDDGQVVISDRTFNIASYVQVHNGSTAIGIQHLELGKPIGYKMQTMNNSSLITEVWILDELASPEEISIPVR